MATLNFFHIRLDYCVGINRELEYLCHFAGDLLLAKPANVEPSTPEACHHSRALQLLVQVLADYLVRPFSGYFDHAISLKQLLPL